MLFTNKKACSDVIGACYINKKGVEIGERQNRCHDDNYDNVLHRKTHLHTFSEKAFADTSWQGMFKVFELLQIDDKS